MPGIAISISLISSQVTRDVLAAGNFEGLNGDNLLFLNGNYFMLLNS